jgi:hypothetical protein
MWGIDADEPHRETLAPGDLILIYLGAPEREFIGRAELASAVHDWTPPEAHVYPGDSLAECCWIWSRTGTRPYR